MSIEIAIEYLTDIINVYLVFLPLTKYTKQEVKKALYLAISALKTIDDMKTKGEEYGQATQRTSIIDSEEH